MQMKKSSVRLQKLLRTRPQESRTPRQILILNREDKDLISASQTRFRRSGAGLRSISNKLPGDPPAAGLRTTLGVARS